MSGDTLPTGHKVTSVALAMSHHRLERWARSHAWAFPGRRGGQGPVGREQENNQLFKTKRSKRDVRMEVDCFPSSSPYARTFRGNLETV